MIAPDGLEVVVSQHVDRRHRYCQCRLCGVVKRCTPRDDFFSLASDGPDYGLLCQSCLEKSIGMRFLDDRGDA